MSYEQNKSSTSNALLEKLNPSLNSIAAILLIVFLIKSFYKKEVKNIIFWVGFLLVGYFYNKNQNEMHIKSIAFYVVDTLQEWIMVIIEFVLDLL